MTIVEAIRQLLLAKPNAHILACAPSNSAADIIAERLHNLGKTRVLRLNAASRDKKRVSANVLDISLINGEGIFCSPPVADLRKFSVVISTCMSGSVPFGIGVPTGHFSHIFIDEAGQASEPEIMIAIKTMANSSTNIILSGDPKQLGPVVRSPIARELGLAVSYLDRLTSNPIYDVDQGKNTTCVISSLSAEPLGFRIPPSHLSIAKLIKNWRSHESILKFPNTEFYRGELQARGDPAITHSILRWDMLPNPQLPIIFHGISGKDERESSSPSFFNIHEALLVKEYVNNLFDDRRLRISKSKLTLSTSLRLKHFIYYSSRRSYWCDLSVQRSSRQDSELTFKTHKARRNQSW